MKITDNHKNAEDAYVAAHAMACDLVGKLNDLLQNLPAPGNKSNLIHCGHVGD